MSDYGPGDRVRVTFEGVVANYGRRLDIDGLWLAFGGVKPVNVEVLERAKPAFKAGDVVLIIGNLGSPRHSLMHGTLAVIERAGGWDGDKSDHYVVNGYSTVAQAVIQQSVHARDLDSFPAQP